MKKFYLVPSDEYMQLKNSTTLEKIQSSHDIASTIQSPEKSELINSYTRARDLLNDDSISNSLKADLYLEELNRFEKLKEKMNDHTQRKNLSSRASANEDMEMSIIEMMPTRIQPAVTDLLTRMKNSGIFSWTPTGALSIHNKRLNNANLMDLIKDVMIKPKNKGEPPHQQRGEYLHGLSQINIPQLLIKNPSALTHYKRILSEISNIKQEVIGEKHNKNEIKWYETDMK